MAKRQSGKKLINSAMVDEYIADYRKRHSITQKELAESLGVNQSRISSIENGSGHYDLEDVCNFAIEYEQSIDDMIDLANRSESAPKREKTFKDILSRLFYIECEAMYTSDIGFSITEQGELRSIDIQFKNKDMINIIDQWVASNSINTRSKSGQAISDIVKDALLKDAVNLERKYEYKSMADFANSILEYAKKTLYRAGLYYEDDIEDLNISLPTDDNGKPQLVYFFFPRSDYEFMRDYIMNSMPRELFNEEYYVIEEIDLLIENDQASFMFD